MRKVIFEKYSLYGNKFIFLDETKQPPLSAAEIARAGDIAKDPVMGLGVEGLIVMQKNSEAALTHIFKQLGCETSLEEAWLKADFIFRYFEEKGLESLSCGNALLSMGAYLKSEYQLRAATFLTEIPSGKPSVCSVFASENDGFVALGIGKPMLLDASIVRCEMGLANSGLQQIFIHFQELGFELQGFFAGTGEPHLVFFYDDSTPERKAVFDLLIGETYSQNGSMAASDRLFHEISMALNTDARFPIGINVNIARAADEKTLVCRTFERRGLERETCACGTGALAVAFVARQLGLTKVRHGEEIRIFPQKINALRQGDFFYFASNDEQENWQLRAKPTLVCRGNFTI